MTKNLLFFLISLCILTACSTNTTLISNVKVNVIKETGYLNSVSNINVIANSDELPNTNAMNQMVATNSDIIYTELTHTADIKSELIELTPYEANIVYRDIAKKIDTLANYRIKVKNMDNATGRKILKKEMQSTFSAMTLSENTINILKTKNKQYVTFILTLGSTRTYENAKDARRDFLLTNALGISLVATTGFGFYKLPQMVYSCINEILIIDVFNNKLVFYNQTITPNGDPANPKDLRQNIFEAFEGYWVKKSEDTKKYIKVEKVKASK